VHLAASARKSGDRQSSLPESQQKRGERHAVPGRAYPPKDQRFQEAGTRALHGYDRVTTFEALVRVSTTFTSGEDFCSMEQLRATYSQRQIRLWGTNPHTNNKQFAGRSHLTFCEVVKCREQSVVSSCTEGNLLV
jgi:hypothetical protein